MLGEAPVCWLGAAHLACSKVSQPSLVRMWILVSLLQIALRKTFIFLIQCIVLKNEGLKAPRLPLFLRELYESF